jgi:hypothetical protein
MARLIVAAAAPGRHSLLDDPQRAAGSRDPAGECPRRWTAAAQRSILMRPRGIAGASGGAALDLPLPGRGGLGQPPAFDRSPARPAADATGPTDVDSPPPAE